MFNLIRDKLIQKATDKFGQIFPCADKASLHDCFTTDDKHVIFWFNTADANTHVLVENVQK